MWHNPDGVLSLTVSQGVFVALLAIELGLLAATRSNNAKLRTGAWTGFFIVPMAAAFVFRAVIAVSARDVLQWDETYYLSTAVTGGAGRGLYPFVFGYPPMPILGGLGHLAWLDVLAVKLGGPSVIALRLVSLAGALASIALMYRLVRVLYGRLAGAMGAVITSALYLMFLTNSARMDAVTFAFVTGGLLAVVTALGSNRRAGHYFAGLVFGLALQAHPDAAVTAMACGLPYFFRWIREIRAAGRVRVPSALLLYGAGFGTGLAIFIVCNVLPDPAAFYRTTAQVRVDATSWYSSGTSSLAGSFLSPSVILAKEAERYRLLFNALPSFEIVAFALAIVAAAVRRTDTDRDVLLIIAGVIAGTAILLNNGSPLYFTHVVPALCVPLAPLFVRPLSRKPWPLQPSGVLGPAACAAFVCALVAVNGARPAATGWLHPSPVDPADEALAQTVHATASRDCTVAGDGRLYVRYFGDYPNFISSRRTEVAYAMMFMGLTDEAEYWRLKQPGVVLGRDLSPGLQQYISSGNLTETGPGIRLDAARCRQ